MNLEQLKHFLADGEGPTVEFKEAGRLRRERNEIALLIQYSDSIKGFGE